MSDEANTEETVEETGPKMAKTVKGITDDAVITILTTENPKRPNSKAYDMYELYGDLADDATVKDALAIGITMGDLRYNVIHGFIEIEGAEVDEYEVKARGTSEEGEEVEEEAGYEAEAEDEASNF